LGLTFSAIDDIVESAFRIMVNGLSWTSMSRRMPQLVNMAGVGKDAVPR
jgi:hypothetical protein